MNKLKINVDESKIYRYFLLTFDDNYVKMGGGLTHSIIKNTNENVCFIVFTQKLKDESIKTLKEFNIPFIIYFIDDLNINYNKDLHKNWPSISVARLFAPFIIEENIDYLYYLDCDFLCINKLDDLFKLKFSESVAICPEVAGNIYKQCDTFGNDNIYCNSGFIIFNINKFKTTYTKEKMLEDLNNMIDNLSFPDQDFMNVYFKRDCLYLNPIKYNNQIYEYIKFKNVKQGLINNTIFIHFSVGKPWNKNCSIRIAKIYRDYVYDCDLKDIVKKNILRSKLLYIPRMCKRILKKVLYA